MDFQKEFIQRKIKQETEHEDFIHTSHFNSGSFPKIKFEDSNKDQIENQLEAITNSPSPTNAVKHSITTVKPIENDLGKGNQICRLCAQIIIGNEIFLYEDIELEKKIKQILPITIEIGDGFPQYICRDCKRSVNTFHEFVCKVINADNVIKGRLNPDDDKNCDDITNATVKEIFGADLNELEQIKPSASPESADLKEPIKTKRIIQDDVYDQPRKIQKGLNRKIAMEFPSGNKVYFSCPEAECLETFLTQKSLCDHIKENHDFPMICLKCGKIFANQTALQKHEDNMHFFKVCDSCGMNFKSLLNFKTHKALHAKVAAHQCVYCYRNFLNRQKLMRHTRQCHSGNFTILVDGKAETE